MTCPECGASNPKGAAWCSLCARPLGAAPQAAPADDPVLATTIEPPPVAETPSSAGPVIDTGGGPAWTCGACGDPNPIEADVCSTCGTSIFEAHGASTDSETDRARAEERAWVPGVGQSALGDSATGGMVVAVIALSGLFGLLMLLGGGSVGAGVASLLIGAGVWAAGWFDTQQRLARGTAILTPGRLLAVAALVILIVLFAASGAANA